MVAKLDKPMTDSESIVAAARSRVLRQGEIVTVCIPMPVVSEANTRGKGHFRKASRAKRQKQIVTHVLNVFAVRPRLPCRVEFTRIARGKLDTDNAVGAFKAVRDSVAEHLGVDDGGDAVDWVLKVEQRKPAKDIRDRCAIEIKFTPLGAAGCGRG
jgi:hypothetical protein